MGYFPCFGSWSVFSVQECSPWLFSLSYVYSQMSVPQMGTLKLFSLQYSPSCVYWEIFLLGRDGQVLLPSFLKKRESSGGSFYSSFLPLHSFCELAEKYTSAQRLRTKEEREILGKSIWLIYQEHSPSPQREQQGYLLLFHPLFKFHPFSSYFISYLEILTKSLGGALKTY